LLSVIVEPGTQHVMPAHQRADSVPQSGRVHVTAVELVVEVRADAAEGLPVTPADPVRVLHRRQVERSIAVDDGDAVRLRSAEVGGTLSDQLPPVVERAALDQFRETHRHTTLVPLPDQSHHTDRVEAEVEKVGTVGDGVGRFTEDRRDVLTHAVTAEGSGVFGLNAQSGSPMSDGAVALLPHECADAKVTVAQNRVQARRVERTIYLL